MKPTQLPDSGGGILLRLCAALTIIASLAAVPYSIAYAIAGIISGAVLIAAGQACDAIVCLARDTERRRLAAVPPPAAAPAAPPSAPITADEIATAEAAIRRAREA